MNKLYYYTFKVEENKVILSFGLEAQGLILKNHSHYNYRGLKKSNLKGCLCMEEKKDDQTYEQVIIWPVLGNFKYLFYLCGII